MGQQVVGRTDEPTQAEFPDVCETPAPPAPEVPVPYPNTGKASDHDKDRPVKVDGDMVNVPDTAFTPSEGDEPGTGGSGPARLPGGAPLLVAVVVVVMVVVVATFILLMGDGNGNGNGGDGDGLVIDPLETTVETVWEPTPGFHLSVVVLNEANDTRSLDGHDLQVFVLRGTEEVGRTSMVLSGDLDAGHGRGVLVNVAVDLTSGRMYEVNVLLRDEGGKGVDDYRTEVTVPVT
jgi:hypothetical protein